MNDILSQLAAAAESEAPAGHGAACFCEGRTEETMVTQKVPIGEEGEFFEVDVPLVTCLECGVAFTDERAERARHAAACAHMGLLAPDEIKGLRNSLGMSRKVFAEAYAIPPASMERWENGRLLQNRSMDLLLRALMLPGVASTLDRRKKPSKPAPVSNVIAFPTLARQSPRGLEDAGIREAGFRLRAHG